MVERTFHAPPLRRLALEPTFLVESAAFRMAAPFLRAPSPHPHTVMVLPGLGATDRSTATLRSMLRHQGHWVHGWGLGRHRIWTRESVAAVERRLEELHERHEAPISLIGISAGGILARELARSHPEWVRQLVTIVSPFRHRQGDDNRIVRIFAAIKPLAKNHFEELPREDDRPPLAMPSASIYSRTDGVIDWRSCLENLGFGRDNIEVRGTHLGAQSNLAVGVAVTDRLSCPPDDWRPFQPPRGTRLLFPASQRNATPRAERASYGVGGPPLRQAQSG